MLAKSSTDMFSRLRLGLVHPGPEARRVEIGEREREVAHVTLGVEDQRRNAREQRLLEEDDREPGLSGARHADDDAVRRQLAGAYDEIVRSWLAGGEVDHLAEVKGAAIGHAGESRGSCDVGGTAVDLDFSEPVWRARSLWCVIDRIRIAPGTKPHILKRDTRDHLGYEDKQTASIRLSAPETADREAPTASLRRRDGTACCSCSRDSMQPARTASFGPCSRESTLRAAGSSRSRLRSTRARS